MAQATKFDDGKWDPSFISQGFGQANSRAMTYGANKYHRDNYRTAPGLSMLRLTNAIVRHAMALLNGEQVDPESGLHHVDHLCAGANMLAETQRLFPEQNDYPIAVWDQPAEESKTADFICPKSKEPCTNSACVGMTCAEWNEPPPPQPEPEPEPRYRTMTIHRDYMLQEDSFAVSKVGTEPPLFGKLQPGVDPWPFWKFLSKLDKISDIFVSPEIWERMNIASTEPYAIELPVSP